AIDAAVGTAMALASQEPWNSGLGGYGGFAIVHRAGQARAEVVDFGPVSPRRLTTANFKLTGRMSEIGFRWAEVEGDANVHGPLAVAVPSAVAGCEALHTRWGRLPMAEVMAPAVALARRGLQLDWFASQKITAAARDLRRYPESARIYLRDGLPPAPPAEGNPGFMPLGALPATMEQLARAGWRDFYEGEIAAALVRDQQTVGGVIDAEDLRACTARVVPAEQVPWRNGRVLQLAGGMTATSALLPVLAAMAEAPYGARPDAAWYRRLAGALRAAYAARLAAPASNDGGETCTTHLTVMDEEGTMVTMTTTLMAGFGSRVVLPQTGLLLNNGIMLFDPRPGQANSLAPSKRLLTNMCPLVLREGDVPMMAGGASGGRHIMAAMFQLMTYIADFGMNPQAAAHAPRISVAGPDGVAADVALGPEVIAAMAADAPVEVVRRYIAPANFANPNMILRHADGSSSGIADNRSPWSVALAQ
ncbi:MAG: gamma-glutamyltransferase, partial [Acetobacteraceae bacterium]|nr:gamma-glutamyltransferase [Acetobacteraceae bacterium]